MLLTANEPTTTETTKAKEGEETEVTGAKILRDEWEIYIPNTLVSHFESSKLL